MDPGTLAIAGMVSSIASTGLGIYGAIAQGQAQAAAAKYQAQVAQVNSRIQQQNAAYERQKGEVDAQTQDLKNRAQLGAIAAASGASGFDMNEGSALDIRTGAAKLGRLDTETVKANAGRRAREFDIASMNQSYQANLYNAQASNASLAGYIGAAGSLVGGIGQVSDKWMDYQRVGLLTPRVNTGGLY